MDKNFIYQPKSITQLKKWYNEKRRQGNIDFIDFDDFIRWYNEQIKSCHYCGLTESESQEIVVRGHLTSNRFPQNGIHGQGTSRGMWLEIDRYNPKDKYSKENAVMCCYFCNNDKSDVFHGDQYKEFQNDRAGFLKKFLNK